MITTIMYTCIHTERGHTCLSMEGERRGSVMVSQRRWPFMEMGRILSG